MKSTVRVDRALNYALFAQRPIKICLDDETFLSIQPLDANDKHLWLPKEECQDLIEKLQSETEVEIQIPYKDSLLKFQARICPEKTSADTLALVYRKTGTTINRRRHPRRSFDSDLEITLEAKSQGRVIKYKGHLFGDVSPEAIALQIPRSSGLLLPGDDVNKIEIRKRKKKILVGQGQVLKSAFRDIKKKDTYTVVVAALRETKKHGGPTKRSVERYVFDGNATASLMFHHPLFPELELSGRVVDLALSGLAFALPQSRYPLPPGCHLDKAIVSLPGKRPIAVHGTVCGPIKETNKKESIYRLRLEKVSPTFVKYASYFLQGSIDRNLVDSETLDDEALWELFFESDFIYEKKRKNLQANRDQLFNTYRTLMKTHSPVSKKLLYKEEGQLRGHLSAIRFFDSSWMVQHLSAVKSETKASVAEALLRAIILFFQDTYANSKANARYGLFFYRPDNLYPALVFGTAKDIINDENICATTDLKYCLPKLGPQGVETSRSEIVEVSPGDPLLSELEHILLEQGQSRLMNIEDLSREHILNLSITDDFESLGLKRSRKVYIALDRETGKHSFAVCNFSSPGLNLSELTNSFRIYSHGTEAALANELAQYCIQSYSETNNPSPILLSEGYVPSSFEESKIYRYWSLDLQHIAQFLEAVESIFNNLRHHIKEMKEKQLSGEAV